MRTSQLPTPAALTWTRSCPAPGCGCGTSAFVITLGGPNRSTRAAFTCPHLNRLRHASSQTRLTSSRTSRSGKQRTFGMMWGLLGRRRERGKSADAKTVFAFRPRRCASNATRF
jgi:hypothetical protein